jgi:hypothetical protein
MDSINHSDAIKIILANFAPHSTHSRQPLDVVLLLPLSSAYSKELTTYLHRRQGIVGVKKGDFFGIFCPAWMTSFQPETIKKTFEATGILPMDKSSQSSCAINLPDKMSLQRSMIRVMGVPGRASSFMGAVARLH